MISVETAIVCIISLGISFAVWQIINTAHYRND